MAAPELVYVCEICQTILEEHHCKAICPNCGRMFDCSDLPLMAANASVDSETAGLKMRPGSDPRDWLPKGEASGAEDAAPPLNEDSGARDLP
jgi:hypothetical protein